MPYGRYGYYGGRSYNSGSMRKYILDVVYGEVETNYIDTLLDGDVDDVPAFIDLTIIAQGVTSEQRLDHKVTPEYLSLNYIRTNQVNILGDPEVPADLFRNNFRFMVIQWGQDTSVGNPSIADILEHTVGTADILTSPYRVDPDKVFKVLWDTHSTPNRSPDTGAIVYVKKYFRGKSLLEVDFNDAATTGKNHIFLFVFCDTVAPLAAGIEGYARFAFKQI